MVICRMPRATQQVIIHQAHTLHKGIEDRGANKRESGFPVCVLTSLSHPMHVAEYQHPVTSRFAQGDQ